MFGYLEYFTKFSIPSIAPNMARNAFSKAISLLISVLFSNSRSGSNISPDLGGIEVIKPKIAKGIFGRVPYPYIKCSKSWSTNESRLRLHRTWKEGQLGKGYILKFILVGINV